MAWFDNMLVPLRVLINDLDEEAYTYTDDTLKKLLVTAASYVTQDIELSVTYTQDYSAVSISPDPSDDQIFTSFVVMKAACLSNQWTFNSQAISQGIRAKLGPVEMEKIGSGSNVLVSLLKDGFCAAYKEMKLQHNYGNVSSIRAVLSPFTHSKYQNY